jgi:hypothetical protein
LRGVINYAPAQVTIDRSHEHAACRARLDKAYPIAADDADDRQQTKEGIPKKAIDEDGSGSGSESQNDAARFPAQATASPEGGSSYVCNAPGGGGGAVK